MMVIQAGKSDKREELDKVDFQFEIVSKGTNADGQDCHDILWQHPRFGGYGTAPAPSRLIRSKADKERGYDVSAPMPDRNREKRQAAEVQRWLDESDESGGFPDPWDMTYLTIADHADAQNRAQSGTMYATVNNPRVMDQDVVMRRRVKEESDKPVKVTRSILDWDGLGFTWTYWLYPRKAHKARVQESITRRNRTNGVKGGRPKKYANDEERKAADKARKARKRIEQQEKSRKGMFKTL